MNPLHFVVLTTVLLSPNPSDDGRSDQILIVDQASLGPVGSYSQGLQLERGWNLVSWYVIPPDTTPLNALMMDDLFDQELQPPGGPDDWFWSEPSENPTDKVGRYDMSPMNPPTFYPEYGKNTMFPIWYWNLRQAYATYMASPAHFWGFTNRPLYMGEQPPQDDFAPNFAWDDYRQAGIPLTPDMTTYWFFISYPKRSELKLRDSYTIDWLTDYVNNPLRYIKDDDGHCYDPAFPDNATLEYLRPGKGYFLGYANANPVINCPWFLTGETADPLNIEPTPPQNLPTTSSVASAHFQFKSRTHWWYPIEIDTVFDQGLTPEVSDEIAVFDGNMCVGAQAFSGDYPIMLAAWKDDIATPDTLDGYLLNDEMTFKWYDVSGNQEITFTPPPSTQAVEVDPYFPRHSGFGNGFAARRSFTNGILAVTQLPREFKLGQNFPNPFNSETMIPLELPQRSHVKIELFNVRGQKLGVIFEGVQNAGWPKIHYNASGLASGMYFCRVTAKGLERGGQYHRVSKMLLLK